MARPKRHSVTGVKLNPILIKRVSLDFEDAVTVWVEKLQGSQYQHIAQMLGANTLRISEVLRGEKFPEAKAEAIDRLAH